MPKAVFQPIIDEVTALTSAVDSAELLLANLAQRVLDAPTLAEAQEVARGIQAQKEELAAAVAANTPAEPPA